jgi:uncharacterized membrane protein
MLFDDGYSRSALKAASWRIIATSATMFVVYVLTGKAVLTIEVGIFEVFLKLFLYFIHERVWEKTRFGRNMRQQAQIDKKIMKIDA